MYLLKYALLTFILELPVFLYFWKKEGYGQAILFCLLLNGFTNPILNTILLSSNINVWLLELGVFAVEAFAAWLIFKPKIGKAILFSILANGFSFGMGQVLHALKWL